jgi:hypothetical protein
VVRELIIATVGAMILIAIGLATINSADNRGAGGSAVDEDKMTASMSLRLAD